MSIKNRDFYYPRASSFSVTEESRMEMKGWKEACQKFTERRVRESKAKYLKLFEVKGKEDIWDTFLESFPVSERRSHDCAACTSFIRKAVPLVTINKLGECRSILLPGEEDFEFKEIPPVFRSINQQLKELVESPTALIAGASNVKGGEKIGVSELLGGFHHMCWTAPNNVHHKHADFAVAQYREQLIRCLQNCKQERVEKVLEWFVTEESFPGHTQVKPCLEWFLHVAQSLEKEGAQKDHLLWKFAAGVPEGFLHSLCSGMASLLVREENIQGKLDQEIKTKFRELMDPMVYQRRVAPAKEGNQLAALQLFAKLGVHEEDWPRRYLRIAEVWPEALIWKETAPEGVNWEEEGKEKKVGSATQFITMQSFIKRVLPVAQAMYYTPTPVIPFYAFVTGEPGTYPFLQWHERSEEGGNNRENLASWYTYARGSKASEAHLEVNKPTRVSHIVKFPHQWKAEVKTHHAFGFLFVLPESQDMKSCGGCLFPSMLRSEFHPVKSVIEDKNRETECLSKDRQEVVGVGIRDDPPIDPITVLVYTKACRTPISYVIDRFE